MGDRGCWCDNGGTCSSSGLCICPTGFKGSTCQFHENASDTAVSKTLEIVIVVACIIFFIINGSCWLFIWYKRKRQLENEGISLDALSRLISVHANRQVSVDQHTIAMSGIDNPPTYEEYFSQIGLDRSQSTPDPLGTPIILPGYLVSHVRNDLKNKRSYSLPNTTIFVPGYYQSASGTGTAEGDATGSPTFSSPSTPVILPGYSYYQSASGTGRAEGDAADSPTFSSPSTPVILPGYMSPVKLSESRSSSPQSPSGSPSGVLSPLARFWKKTSPGNQSLDHTSPGSPVLPVTISPLVAAEVKVDKAQHPSTPTHYNYITTPTKSRLQGKKANVPKLFIPPHDTTCSIVDQCKSAPVLNSKSRGKKSTKKQKTKRTDSCEDTTAMTSLMPETSDVNNESNV